MAMISMEVIVFGSRSSMGRFLHFWRLGGLLNSGSSRISMRISAMSFFNRVNSHPWGGGGGALLTQVFWPPVLGLFLPHFLGYLSVSSRILAWLSAWIPSEPSWFPRHWWIPPFCPWAPGVKREFSELILPSKVLHQGLHWGGQWELNLLWDRLQSTFPHWTV